MIQKYCLALERAIHKPSQHFRTLVPLLYNSHRFKIIKQDSQAVPIESGLEEQTLLFAFPNRTLYSDILRHCLGFEPKDIMLPKEECGTTFFILDLTTLSVSQVISPTC